ncbi:MAG TPA: hypothetical protein VJ775_00545, partial [Sphingomicrobium sp.]|nr:hypothetical protein [Sphingomicrobium sp.]
LGGLLSLLLPGRLLGLLSLRLLPSLPSRLVFVLIAKRLLLSASLGLVAGLLAFTFHCVELLHIAPLALGD